MEKLDFFGEIPCPVKLGFQKKVNAFMLSQYKKDKTTYKSYIPNVLGSNMKHNILNVGSEEDLPRISLTYGYGDITAPYFIENFLSKGVFGQNPFYELAFLPEVVVTIKEEGKSYPESWVDLLDRFYKGRVCLFGANGMPDFLLPLMIYVEYGTKGVESLFENVSSVASPAEIARKINQRAHANDIFVMPYIFAKECDGQGVEMIVPKEGALVEPIVILQKSPCDVKSLEFSQFLKSINILQEFIEHGFLDQENLLQTFGKVYQLSWEFVISTELDWAKKEIYRIWKEKFCYEK